ncbi:MAG: dihydrolipoamide acetyltransferase family protein [Anaerolineaceae bacterium]|jgi:pyruvate dehydrogenase E2 component (dihydrolipoamide acetyltransferase)
MAETVTMPKLGFDMAEGTLVRWVKAEGENVIKGDVLAEIETDKATVEVESNFSGVLNRRLVEQGTVVPVGSPIAIIGTPGEIVEDGAEAGPSTPTLAAAPEKVAAPAQARPSIPAGTAGPAIAAAPEVPSGVVKASPLAKRIAQDREVDLSRLHGSGPEGRIVKKDVEAFLASAPAAPAGMPQPVAPSPAVFASAPVPTKLAQAPVRLPVLLSSWQAGETQADQHMPVERLRAAIGRRMADSKQHVPHFYVTHEYDMEAVMKMRSEINAMLSDDQKLSVNDFIVKAVGMALRQFPNLNASLAENEVIRHGRVNVGVAVALSNGLMTVVVKDADRKPLRVISQEVKEMVARARLGKVHTEDIEGSTFSISNLGMFDVEHFIAIINPPEAAILAVGSAKQVPVVVNGEVKVGMRLRATLSADHRVTDGAEGAQFLQSLAVLLEQPLKLLI